MTLENIANKKIDNINQEPLEYIESKNTTEKLEILKPDISYIEKTSLASLVAQNNSIDGIKSFLGSNSIESNKEGLSDEEKNKIKEEHPEWSDEIIDSIASWKEYEIYSNSNLTLEYINGKPCLIRTDINLEQKDVQGRTNRERMESGLSPLDQNGRPIELHHIGQRANSPLVELTYEEHHLNGNDSILHDKTIQSEVHGAGNNWNTQKRNHWETRSS